MMKGLCDPVHGPIPTAGLFQVSSDDRRSSITLASLVVAARAQLHAAAQSLN